MEALNQSRPIIAARGVGLAQGAIDHAKEFITNRHAFGQAVSDFQGVRWMLADMQIQTKQPVRSYTNQRLQSMLGELERTRDPGRYRQVPCDGHGDESFNPSAVQLFGASGISNEYPINRYFRDAKVLQIVEGTNQIQRNLISRIMLS